MKIQLEHCLKKDFPFLFVSLHPRLWMSSRWTWTIWSWMTLTPQMLTLMMTFSMMIETCQQSAPKHSIEHI